jgi:hypothetical protein
MKKVILSVLLVLGAVAYTTAQEATSACTVPAVSNWSAGVKLGPGYVGGLDMSVGGIVEYSINPFIGIGLEGDYIMQLGAVQGIGYGSLNLSNLCATYRTGFWKKTNIFMVAGGGLRLAATKSILAMAGLNAEYNLSDAVALQAGGEAFLGNGKALLASVGVRYKFASATKKHALNIAMCDYIPTPVPVVITETKGKDCCEQINARLKAAEQLQSTLQQKAQKVADDLNALQTKK